jgi:glyoxylase-like metal-dependent hydrolase (beta-lactamase superfamily II)
MINIKTFVFNPLQENTYVLYDDSNACIIIDPGCYDTYEKEELVSFIKMNELTPQFILNTHCHIDHVVGNQFVKEYFNIKLFVPEKDAFLIKAATTMASMYGFHKFEESFPDDYIKENEVIQFGNSSLTVLQVPGHSPGHVAFYNPEQGFCINGDVLFKGGFGRYDLPGGDFKVLVDSIRNVMFKLPNETVVYTGHGPSTTIEFEKRFNPIAG